MDPEATIRKHLSEELGPHFNVCEEVKLETRCGTSVRSDLLIISKQHPQIAVAIEIKSCRPKQPKNYRDTFYQAFKYVGSEVKDSRIDKRIVNFALVYQDRLRTRPITNNPNLNVNEIIESSELDGIELAYNSLNVGVARVINGKLCFVFGHNSAWRIDQGWKAEFYRRDFSKGCIDNVDTS